MLLLFLCLFSCLHSEDLHQETFSTIYESKLWGTNSAGEGFSGGGSTPENARPYIEFLQSFLKTHRIRTVVDAGCGDWEFSQYIDWTDIEYIGYDVVPFVIEKNQQKFSAPNIHFIHENFLTSALPEADLLLCKEVLQHLSNEDILNFIPQLSQFKYCLITNDVYPGVLTSDNPDIVPGSCRKIDLRMRPFRLPMKNVLHYVAEGVVHQVALYTNQNP